MNAAIKLLFSGDDPLIVLVLAGNASALFAKVVEKHCPDRFWHQHAQQVSALSANEYFLILRKGQNFLKHAGRDDGELLTWNTVETEAIILTAVLNAGELDGNSTSQQLFRSCYFATRQADLSLDKAFVKEPQNCSPASKR